MAPIRTGNTGPGSSNTSSPVAPDPNLSTDDFGYPLRLALLSGEARLVEALMNHGADPTLPEHLSATARISGNGHLLPLLRRRVTRGLQVTGGGGMPWRRAGVPAAALPEAGAEAWTLDAAGEYGVRLRGGSLLTWFGSFSQSDYGAGSTSADASAGCLPAGNRDPCLGYTDWRSQHRLP